MTLHGNAGRWSELGPHVMAVAQSWRRAIAQAVADDGLSDATALPLVYLLRDGSGIRQWQLADRLGLEGSSIVRVLDCLEKDGLVERREDELDRRAKRVFLTPAGRTRAEQIETVFAELREELLGALPQDDIAATMRVLHAVSTLLTERLDKQGTR